MRILVVSNQYAPAVGGIEVLLRQLCPALLSHGHDVSVLTATHPQAPELHGEVDGIPVHRTELFRALVRRDPAGLLRAKKAVARVVREVSPDVIHGHDLGPNLWSVVNVDPGAPVLTTMHMGGLATIGVTQQGPMAQLLGRTTWLTGVSQSVVDKALMMAPGLTDRCSVIANGVPPTTEPAPPDPTRRRIVAAGLAPEKGFDVLLRALPIVLRAEPSTELILVGDGPERRELETLIDQLDIRHAVTLAGAVRHDRIAEVLATASVVTIPSRYEGMPMIALEAGAAGRAVVATPSDGLAEVVLDGETGLFVPHEDEASLAALIGLLRDPARAAAFGAAARRRVVDRFSLERTVDAYDELYHRLVRTETKV